jgi:predicted secreted protein
MALEQTTIKLAVGESTEIVFKSNAMGGYEWTVTIENEGIIQVEKKIGEVDEKVMPLGSSAPEIFTILALKGGTALLHFKQQRPWENEPPRKEQVYVIEIS